MREVLLGEHKRRREGVRLLLGVDGLGLDLEDRLLDREHDRLGRGELLELLLLANRRVDLVVRLQETRDQVLALRVELDVGQVGILVLVGLRDPDLRVERHRVHDVLDHGVRLLVLGLHEEHPLAGRGHGLRVEAGVEPHLDAIRDVEGRLLGGRLREPRLLVVPRRRLPEVAGGGGRGGGGRALARRHPCAQEIA